MLVCVGFVSALYGELANEFSYDPYEMVKPGITQIGILELGAEPFFGPYPLLFYNNSDEVLVIADYESSCDCVRLGELPAQVEPYGQAEIAFTFHPQRSGFFQVNVELLTEQTTRQSLRAIARARVNLQHPVQALYAAWPAVLADPAHLISAESALAMLEDPKASARLIDPRHPSAYERVHAAGAINLQFHQLIHKTSWQETPLIIIDEGIASASVHTGIVRLKAAGFQRVHLIRGGLRHWADLAQPLSGIHADEQAWVELSATQLATSALREHFAILAYGEQDLVDEVTYLFPENAIHIWPRMPEWWGFDAGNENERYEKLIQDWAAGISAEVPWLLISRQGGDYRNLRHFLNRQDYYNVFELRKGVDGLTRYLAAMQKRKSENNHVVPSGAQNPLGKTVPVPLRDKKCAGCP